MTIVPGMTVGTEEFLQYRYPVPNMSPDIGECTTSLAFGMHDTVVLIDDQGMLSLDD